MLVSSGCSSVASRTLPPSRSTCSGDRPRVMCRMSSISRWMEFSEPIIRCLSGPDAVSMPANGRPRTWLRTMLSAIRDLPRPPCPNSAPTAPRAKPPHTIGGGSSTIRDNSAQLRVE